MGGGSGGEDMEAIWESSAGDYPYACLDTAMSGIEGRILERENGSMEYPTRTGSRMEGW